MGTSSPWLKDPIMLPATDDLRERPTLCSCSPNEPSAIADGSQSGAAAAREPAAVLHRIAGSNSEDVDGPNFAKTASVVHASALDANVSVSACRSPSQYSF